MPRGGSLYLKKMIITAKGGRTTKAYSMKSSYLIFIRLGQNEAIPFSYSTQVEIKHGRLIKSGDGYHST